MKKNIANFIFLFLLFISLAACKNEPANSLEAVISKTEADKSFLPFYTKFHSEEAYQMEHVQFPLQGLPQRTDSAGLAGQSAYTQKEDWVFQSALQEGLGFRREIMVVSPGMIEELLVNDEQAFAIRRRFAKLSGEWYLIYYAKGPIKQ